MMSVARIRFAFSILVASTLAACGGTTEVAPPKKDLVPASVTAASTDTLRGVVGTVASLPLSVVVKNAAGELLDTTLVTFAVVTGNGTVANATVRTNGAGAAQTSWTLGGTVGLQTATATVGALPAVTFRAVATVGAVAAITKVAGDLQTASVNTNVPIAPQVKLVDRFGNPVPQTPVGFAATGGGGSVNGGVSNTDANGIATVTSWRLGTTLGVNTLTASSGALSVAFTATATFGAPATITLTPATVGDLFVGQTQQLTPRVVDASNNVITNATVTYTSSLQNVATVSSAGLITAVGPGTATITAAAGTVNATIAVTVIGHPGTALTDSLDFGFVPPSDIAFTNNRMVIGVAGLQKLFFYDATGKTLVGTVSLLSALPFVLGPTRAAGPVVAINVGTTSRMWFVDPNGPAVTDSVDIPQVVTAAAIKSDGSRVYTMLSNGNLAITDVASKSVGQIALGGGVTKLRVAPGDTLLYALTAPNVGVIFEIDMRTNTVRRQIIATVTGNDFAIAPDGLFYLLDGPNGLVRIFDINTNTVIRSVGVTADANTIALSPDGQAIWLTHSVAAITTIYTGNKTNGFISAGRLSSGLAPPIRAYFSPSGSFAAVANLNGFVNLYR